MAEDKTEILELYKVMIETITANEQRRQSASQVYIALLSGGLALWASLNIDTLYIVFPAGIIALVWYSSITYFRKLTKAKWKVVEKLEDSFSCKPFGLEWRILNTKKKCKCSNIELSILEVSIPAIILIGCVLYICFRIMLYFIT